MPDGGEGACLAQRCEPSKFVPNHPAKEDSSSMQPNVRSHAYQFDFIVFQLNVS